MWTMIVFTLFYLIFGGAILLIYRRLSLRSVRAEMAAIERISSFITQGEGEVMIIGRGIAKMSFVRCLVFVADRTAEDAVETMQIILRYYHIESYLLKRIEGSSSREKAYYLALLARLPISKVVAGKVSKYMKNSSSDVRFYALLCMLAVVPELAVKYISELDERLSRRDIAEMLSVIGRGYCPIPYTPLLLSNNYNMQLLGIAMVRRFGIYESCKDLMHLVEYGEPELRMDALEALAYMSADCSDDSCSGYVV